MPSGGDDVAVFWDYENCEVPTDISAYYAIWEIYRVAEKYGTVKLFNAYLEASKAKPAFRSDLLSSEVRLVDCPHFGKKEVADRMIIVDIFAYALDNAGRSTTIILITGDGDFTRAVITLTRRDYRVILISPAQVSRVLARTASVLLDWTTDVLKSQPRSRTGSSHNGPPSHYYTSDEDDLQERPAEDGYSSYESDYGKSMRGLPTPDDTSEDSDKEHEQPESLTQSETPSKPRRKIASSRANRSEIKRASDLPPTSAEATPNNRSSKRDAFFKEEPDLATQVKRLTLEEHILGSSQSSTSTSATSTSADTGYEPDVFEEDYRDTCGLEDINFARHFDRDATPKPTSGRAGRPTKGTSSVCSSPTKPKPPSLKLAERISNLQGSYSACSSPTKSKPPSLSERIINSWGTSSVCSSPTSSKPPSLSERITNLRGTDSVCSSPTKPKPPSLPLAERINNLQEAYSACSSPTKSKPPSLPERIINPRGTPSVCPSPTPSKPPSLSERITNLCGTDSVCSSPTTSKPPSLSERITNPRGTDSVCSSPTKPKPPSLPPRNINSRGTDSVCSSPTKSKPPSLPPRNTDSPTPVRVTLVDRISSPAPSSSGSSLSNSSIPPSPTSPTHLYSPKQKEYYSQIFSALITTLRLELSRGHEHTLRNALAPMMLSVYGLDGVGEVYARANCAKGGFKEYLERARNVGIVEVGGVGEGRWVSLRTEWE